MYLESMGKSMKPNKEQKQRDNNEIIPGLTLSSGSFPEDNYFFCCLFNLQCSFPIFWQHHWLLRTVLGPNTPQQPPGYTYVKMPYIGQIYSCFFVCVCVCVNKGGGWWYGSFLIWNNLFIQSEIQWGHTFLKSTMGLKSTLRNKNSSRTKLNNFPFSFVT